MVNDIFILSYILVYLYLSGFVVLIVISGNTVSMIWLCSSGWVGIRYANVGGVNINDPDCNVTVCVVLGFASFSVVSFTYEIYTKRKQCCLRFTVCHFHVQNSYYSTMPR